MLPRFPVCSKKFFWVLVLLLAGCATPQLSKTPENVLLYPYVAVSPQELTEFKAQVAAHPKEAKSAKAYFWIAQDEFNQSDWGNADKSYGDLLKRFPHSEWAGVARLMQARSRVKLKNAAEALALLYVLVKPAAKTVVELKSAALGVGRDIINDKLTLAELVKVRSSYTDTPWAAQALFVSGKRLLDAGSPDQATGLFSQFLQAYPDHEFAGAARDLLEKASHLAPLNRYKLGCLLPLTGPYAPYGRALKQGLDLALQEVNTGRSEDEHLALVVLDSEANTAVAVAGLKKLVEEEKVLSVIGPVLSTSAKALLPELSRLRVPVISPSASDPGLAGQSPYFFRYLLTNEQQGEAMAEYLVLRRGFKRIGILHAESRYDRSLAEAFAKKAAQLGCEAAVNAEYASGTTDFKDALLELGGVDPGPIKNRELEERKSLDGFLETWSQQIADLLAPEAQKVTLAQAALATPVPGKRVAIIRFTENGSQTQQEQMGKKVSERFSYALAAKSGLEVLTQRQTFDTLRKLQLSPLALDPEGIRRFAGELNVGYVVTGSIEQKDEDDRVAVPGHPLPVHYLISAHVHNAGTGQELCNLSQTWVKMIAPETNARNLEALYLPVALEDALSIVPQLAFYDLPVKIFGPDAWITPRLLREGPEILNGAVVATGFWLDNPAPVSQTFVKQFIAAYTAPPSNLAAQAFDTLELIAKIDGLLPREAVSRDDFVNALLKEKGFNGITGRAWVESDGEIRREPFFLKLDQGILKKDE
jgi:ABC-type branched-subunit amino acid transport system substrate-binding protein/TolB-like protein